jgi:hypothetical protein
MKERYTFDYLFDASTSDEFRNKFTIQDIEDMAWYEDTHQ